MNLNLKGKNVLITGGSKGIGKAIASAFFLEGANVSIVGRNVNNLNDAKNEIGREISTFSLDLTIANSREKLIEEFIEKYGRIDVLVNNAGGSSGSNLSETPMSDFYKAFELNYFSTVHLSKLAIEEMKKNQEGSIINITSISGRESGGSITYNNAKSALISFTKSLADEVISDGIRVNSIAPGSVIHPTGNWQKRLEENPKKMEAFIANEIPAGRFGTPEEIANIAIFLASEKSSWVVGSSLNVDGGQSRMNF